MASSKSMTSQSNTVSPVQMIPLGGEQEIGKNTWVFRYEDDIILLDAGLGFPSSDMHGVNIVLPDVTYLKQNRDKIRGMIVTHGHEDHIGGIPYHLREFDIPIIYGPKLALALLKEKLKEAGMLNRTQLQTVEPRQIVPLGKNFFAEFIRNTHSFADSFTIALHTPAGVIIQTGDFKIDYTPVDGEYFDLQRLAEHGEKGVLCLISDSTNAEVPGHTPSESAVIPALSKAIAQAPGRALVTTFASSVHRVNVILQIAEQQGRVVSLLGRSMLNVVAHARQLGYIRCKDETLQPMHVVNQLPDNQVIILCTGSQGEPLAAMTRIARDAHPQVKIKKGDTVIFSANPIPGNTLSVTAVVDELMRKGAHVVYGKTKGLLHVSGHGCQDEQRLMLSLTKPKFFVPTHGEYRMLVEHAKTAMSLGIPEENIVIIDNGNVVEVTPDSIRVAEEKVPAGIQMLDNSRQGLVLNRVMEERQQIASEGMVVVAVSVDATGSLINEPQVQGVGLASRIDSLQRTVKGSLGQTLRDIWPTFARRLEQGEVDIDWTGIRAELEKIIRRLAREQFQGKPNVVVMLQHPETERKAKGSPSQEEGATAEATSPARSRKRRSAAAVAS
jgi:ribonuclease J